MGCYPNNRIVIENFLDNAATKIKNTHPNLHWWKNWKQNTPFAPVYNLPLWIEDLNPCFIDELYKVIISSKIADLKNWEDYNIFTLENQAINFLQKNILRVYIDYMNAIKVSTEKKLWIRGWVAKLNKGDNLVLHAHSFHENTYLSGNVMISNHKTTTDYSIPHFTDHYESFYKVENKPARITLFPSWVLHKVDTIEEDNRISIGFDIYTSHTMNYILNKKENDLNFNNSILYSIPLEL